MELEINEFKIEEVLEDITDILGPQFDYKSKLCIM